VGISIVLFVCVSKCKFHNKKNAYTHGMGKNAYTYGCIEIHFTPQLTLKFMIIFQYFASSFGTNQQKIRYYIIFITQLCSLY